jgi:hypothetical protein
MKLLPIVQRFDRSLAIIFDEAGIRCSRQLLKVEALTSQR